VGAATAETKDDGEAHVGAAVEEMTVHKMSPRIKRRFIQACIRNAYLLTVFDVSDSPELQGSILKVLCSVRPACM
jgi:hypothetical protein